MSDGRANLINYLSTCLRIIILFTTVLLDFLIIGYHFIEVKISLTETGHNQWSLGFSTERVCRLVLELIICSICPFPGTGSVSWPLLGFHQQTTIRNVDVPVHVLLCIPMFLRLYIACRFMVLHSSMFQNTSTKTIASLNQISVDFAFVIKTQLYNRPLTIICVSTGCFWVVMALTQCERYSRIHNLSGYEHFIDYAWFEVVTFFSIGYGDIQVETYCGRGYYWNCGNYDVFAHYRFDGKTNAVVLVREESQPGYCGVSVINKAQTRSSPSSTVCLADFKIQEEFVYRS
ncbi:hypothetical protein L596_013481 [Steinernema carpocapsae]|uniref:Potassium channel domain-containing protein n=1 Tax=Steinernema carpocapsae TaxID=34508 RepID=A0A4V6XWG4_STECR|nr:hypothetical protein L596_013481 [Steinernema carpocapsae]